MAINSILAHSDCWNEIPETAYLIDKFTSLSSREPKIKVPADAVSAAGLLPGSQMVSCHCVLTW